MKSQASLALIGILLVACEKPAPPPSHQKADDRGAAREKSDHGKADAWNGRNNPAGLRIELNKNLAELPLRGASENQPWPDTYWPTYKDSVNVRWQTTGNFLHDLSPVEKFDVAFNGWDPKSVEGLRPFNPRDCSAESFDSAYYDELGPLAGFVSRHKGNADTREAALNGELDDQCQATEDGACVLACGEKPEEQEEQSEAFKSYHRCVERCDRGGIETWWGLCHAWAPAAILEKEPLHPVIIPTEHGDIQFEVGDIKALFALMYDRTNATLIGGRCNDFNVERDETTGRITNEDCRDLNAGAFHVAMTNLLGIQKRGFVEDRTFDYEVWNQPVKGFDTTVLEEISIEDAHQLLHVDAESPSDCIHGYSGAADEYCYNRNIDALFKVTTNLHWLTESDASTRALGATHMYRYSETDTYTYILEVKDGQIVGGEWYGESVDDHPDFVWLPTGPGYTPPNFEIENVRMLNRLAQKPVDERDVVLAPVKVTSGELHMEIPDNDRDGVKTTLSVMDDTLTQASLKVRVYTNIEHTYSGDLELVLHMPNGDTQTLRDREGGSTQDISDTFEIKYPGDINGDWTLSIRDHYARDVGQIVDWSLVFSAEIESEVVPPRVTTTNYREATIPDHDTDGINSYIDIDANGTVDTVEVDVNVEHTYVGDLVIQLKKGGVTHTLHNREGGSDDNLQKTFKSDQFRGLPVAGRWYLKIQDLANHDIGTRKSWTLRIH